MNSVPHYNIDDVKNAVKQDQFKVRGRPVQWSIDGLGYSREDIICCFMALTDKHYYKSYDYPNNNSMPDDAYRLSYTKAGSNFTDDLYIKFRLNKDCLSISLGSFHRDR